MHCNVLKNTRNISQNSTNVWDPAFCREVYCVQKLWSHKGCEPLFIYIFITHCCLCSDVVGSLNSPAYCMEMTQHGHFPWYNWQCTSLVPKNWVYFTFSQQWKINVETNLRHSIGCFRLFHHKPCMFSIKSYGVVPCRIVSCDGVYENRRNMWLSK